MPIRIPSDFHSGASDTEFRQHGIDRSAGIVKGHLSACQVRICGSQKTLQLYLKMERIHMSARGKSKARIVGALLKQLHGRKQSLDLVQEL